MIELDALREQLRLLGHDLPDDQIVTILEEMNIDFSADAAATGSVAAPIPIEKDNCLEAASNSLGSLSLGAQEQQQRSARQPAYGYTGYQGLSSSSGGTAQQPSLLSMQVVGAQSPQWSHEPQQQATSAAYHSGESLSAAKLQWSGDQGVHADTHAEMLFGVDDGLGSIQQRAAKPKESHEWYGNLSGGNNASPDTGARVAQRSLLHELGSSNTVMRVGACKPGDSLSSPNSSSFWADGQSSGLKQVGQFRAGASVGAARHGGACGGGGTRWPPAAGMCMSGRGALDLGLGRDFGDEDEDDCVDDTGDADQGRAWAGRQHVSASAARPHAAKRGGHAAAGAKHEHDGHSGASDFYDDLADDVLPVPDAEHSGVSVGRMRPPSASGRAEALTQAQRAALRSAASAASAPPARPSKYQWHEHLRSTSPVAASVASLPRSLASTAAGSHASSKPGSGPKKVDRVKRYQQMQQTWSKDSFLRHSAPKPANFRQAGAQARKPDNFHAYFAIMHAMEADARSRAKASALSKASADSRAERDYVVPTSKRRDSLRWEMRTRMQG